MVALSRVIVLLSVGLSVSLFLRERSPRLLWWVLGAQFLAVVAGCTLLHLGDAGSSFGSPVEVSTRLLICVFGPATLLSALVAAWTIDKLSKRRGRDGDTY